MTKCARIVVGKHQWKVIVRGTTKTVYVILTKLTFLLQMQIWLPIWFIYGCLTPNIAYRDQNLFKYQRLSNKQKTSNDFFYSGPVNQYSECWSNKLWYSYFKLRYQVRKIGLNSFASLYIFELNPALLSKYLTSIYNTLGVHSHIILEAEMPCVHRKDYTCNLQRL